MKLRLFEDNSLEIVVKDWGVGIADVEQARTPLFTTGSEERSGMGFTIMESFMNQLAVKSAPRQEPPSPCVSVSPPRVPAKR